MLGAGVFAAFGPAARAAGNGLLLGLVLAALVAYCNATSSASLAARYPESGGAYVYGRKRLGPLWGFLAGWSFVFGKLASCAAMALTFGHYAFPAFARPLAVAAVLALTAVNSFGVQKTHSGHQNHRPRRRVGTRCRHRGRLARRRGRHRTALATRHEPSRRARVGGALVFRLRGLRAHRDARRGSEGARADDSPRHLDCARYGAGHLRSHRRECARRSRTDRHRRVRSPAGDCGRSGSSRLVEPCRPRRRNLRVARRAPFTPPRGQPDGVCHGIEQGASRFSLGRPPPLPRSASCRARGGRDRGRCCVLRRRSFCDWFQLVCGIDSTTPSPMPRRGRSRRTSVASPARSLRLDSPAASRWRLPCQQARSSRAPSVVLVGALVHFVRRRAVP